MAKRRKIKLRVVFLQLFLWYPKSFWQLAANEEAEESHPASQQCVLSLPPPSALYKSNINSVHIIWNNCIWKCNKEYFMYKKTLWRNICFFYCLKSHKSAQVNHPATHFAACDRRVCLPFYRKKKSVQMFPNLMLLIWNSLKSVLVLFVLFICCCFFFLMDLR